MLTEMQRIQMLQAPAGRVDAVLDTDTYNEIDDQFALAYMLESGSRIRTKAIFAAPFYNANSASPADGMEKSYDEVLKLLSLMKRTDLVPFVKKGSRGYLRDEHTPQESEAARYLIEFSKDYSPENPLYVVAIGAITNIASALLLDETLKERITVIWLGGHALHYTDTKEFNMYQDIAAARVVFGCGVPLVQYPCKGVVSAFQVSEAELDRWFRGANPLCDYLTEHTKEAACAYAAGKPWTRVIWDVTAVSWLTGSFCGHRLIAAPQPEYDFTYGSVPDAHLIQYVYYIDRDKLFLDLVQKLTGRQF